MKLAAAAPRPAAVFHESDPRSAGAARVVPPGAKIKKIGNLVLGYEHNPHHAEREAPGGGWTRIAALGTRKRMRSLAALRRDNGHYLGNLAGWAEAVALIATIIDDDASHGAIYRHCRYIGLKIADEVLEPIGRKVAAAHAAGAVVVNSRILGELLELTIIERDELGIRTIDSCEETADEREKRLARERSSKRRRERGAEPRSASISATEPWIRDGYKTRRTWERHGKQPKNVADTSRLQK